MWQGMWNVREFVRKLQKLVFESEKRLKKAFRTYLLPLHRSYYSCARLVKYRSYEPLTIETQLKHCIVDQGASERWDHSGPRELWRETADSSGIWQYN